ncbi:MAG TPA: hypothetical protein VN428_14585 [Bryobacteraceae bacterium]|nr:hypothetical protein [Bryobacteraceae bacterium]
MSIAAPARKRLLVAAFLCAFVCAYAAPVVSHFHQDFSQHCCWLCQVGPSPFLQPAASALLAPVFRIAWLEWAPGPDVPPEVRPQAHFSRGPPA